MPADSLGPTPPRWWTVRGAGGRGRGVEWRVGGREGGVREGVGHLQAKQLGHHPAFQHWRQRRGPW